MAEPLFPYYERELVFLRQLTQEFAQKYPTVAGRLMLETNYSTDPQVERILESFALLAGRLHQKLDDEFPELTDALLGVVFPHYLVSVPSLAILQFDLDAARAQLPDGFVIPRGSQLHTQQVGDVSCKFRTAYPVTLWPVALTDARLQAPPFPPGLRVPAGTGAVLRLQLESQSGLNFTDLSLERLRFYLNADSQALPHLYQLLFNHVTQVVFRPPEPDLTPAPLLLTPEECLGQVGFEADEGLLPYPSGSPLGYRLLTELFTFPGKFQFLDLGGWKRVRRAGFQNRVEVVLFLDRAVKRLEQTVSAATFLLGCTPVVNLFEQPAEPIPLTHALDEYRVVADAAHPQALEVYSIDAVSSADPASGRTWDYQPFHSFRHAPAGAFWYGTRRPSAGEGGQGTDVYLSLVDLAFKPCLPVGSTLVVRTTCSNRDLPAQLQAAAGELSFELEAAAPLAGIRCLRPPTLPLRPPTPRGRQWRLVSHLNVNHLSLSDPLEGLEALQEMLRLYDLSDPEAGQQEMAAVNRLTIEGIVSMATRPVTRRVSGAPASGFCRGVEVTLEFDEDKYYGTGVFLFASVLERFLSLYASLNSFCQLVARVKQAEAPLKKWPPRPGELPLV